jgi:hypothetical protein
VLGQQRQVLPVAAPHAHAAGEAAQWSSPELGVQKRQKEAAGVVVSGDGMPTCAVSEGCRSPEAVGATTASGADFTSEDGGSCEVRAGAERPRESPYVSLFDDAAIAALVAATPLRAIVVHGPPGSGRAHVTTTVCDALRALNRRFVVDDSRRYATQGESARRSIAAHLRETRPAFAVRCSGAGSTGVATTGAGGTGSSTGGSSGAVSGAGNTGCVWSVGRASKAD